MDKETEGLSEHFRQKLQKIRNSLGEERTQTNLREQGSLVEVRSYIDSIYFRMAGIATICQKSFDPSDTKLAECLTIFKKDIDLAFMELMPLLIEELESKSKGPQ